MKGSNAAPGRAKDLVALGSHAAASALGGWLLLRTQLEIGAVWTDGLRRWRAAGGDGIRHAVWDRPRVLAGSEGGSDPALSPDGRRVVFAAGERGLNAELWIAERAGDGLADARPLAGLNSAADELSPAFGEVALYFASDRPGGAGGLDLWRVPFQDERFGLPERLALGLDTPAEERDPAPLPGTDAIAFASNRPRGGRADFDLYTARPDPSGAGYRCTALDELNTPFDERDPAFSPDGRSLYFSSDRPGGTGGFDLWRSVRDGERWLAPELVPGVSGPSSERGPAVAANGFELWFSLEEAPGARELARARSLELLRLPPPPASLQELLLLAALLLLAGLALLSKRWRALDFLYKCFLASLLLHLLLMLYLRTVHPRGRPFEPGHEEPAFRVRLAPEESTPAASAGLQAARGLESPRAAPERAILASPIEAAVAPGLEPLPEPEHPESPPPERAELALEPASELSSPGLAEREASIELLAARAPALALEARAQSSSRALEAPAEPSRRSARTSDLAPASIAPSPARIEAPRAPAEETLAVAPRPLDLGPALPRSPSPETEIAGPAESLERTGGPARALEVSATPSSASPERGPSQVSRRALSHPPPAPARPSSFSSPSQPRAPAEQDSPAPERLAPAVAAVGASPPTELRDPADAAGRTTAREDLPAASDLTAGLAHASPSSDRPSEVTSPAPAPGRANLPAPAMAPSRPVERALAPGPASMPPDEPAPRLAHTPYQNRFGEQKLRALEEFGGGAETERAVAAGLAYLAGIQGRAGCWGARSDAHEKYRDVRIGKTGLALLAFLGAGHVPGGETEHAGVSGRAVRFLLAAQDPASGHFGESCSYGHGIATYALAECFALTRDEELREPLEGAIGVILRQQRRERDPRLFGGWGYYFADGHVWNGDAWPRTSITAWQVMALESARLGGLEVPAEAFEAARAFVLGAWDARARAFRYDHDPERLSSAYPILPASTPAALFALSLLGVELDRPELSQARRFVLTRAPDRYRYTGDDDFVAQARGNLYFWYYATLAMFRVGSGDWERWNTAMKETLLPSQAEDGSWQPLDPYAAYAGDEDDERAYTTAMCVLSLEVYYRYFTPLLQVR